MATTTLEVHIDGDWLVVKDEYGTEIARCIRGFGPYAPAAVDVIAALASAVAEGMHGTEEDW